MVKCIPTCTQRKATKKDTDVQTHTLENRRKNNLVSNAFPCIHQRVLLVTCAHLLRHRMSPAHDLDSCEQPLTHKVHPTQKKLLDKFKNLLTTAITHNNYNETEINKSVHQRREEISFAID